MYIYDLAWFLGSSYKPVDLNIVFFFPSKSQIQMSSDLLWDFVFVKVMFLFTVFISTKTHSVLSDFQSYV